MRNPRPEPGARDSSDTDELLPSNASVSTKSRASIQARRNGTAATGRRKHFARRMVFEQFGYRHARAIDYDNFVDRRPSDVPKPSPGVIVVGSS